MSTKVLVLFGSKHGATAEIALHIAERLRAAGLDVDAASADQPVNPRPYDAVVLGSAVYAGRWRSDAVDYLRRNADSLTQRAVWLFSSGPTGEGDPSAIMDGWTFPASEQDIADRIGPRDVAYFGGELDRDRLNLAERVMVKMAHAPIGDFRDWDSIDAWADRISSDLTATAERA